MPIVNVFHQRRILTARLNDLEAQIPILVAATAEELSQPENHFNMTEEEKILSRLQLFIKKGKMFGYEHKQPTLKISQLASDSITLFGKPQRMAPVSIMQNEAFFLALKEKANQYLESVLKVKPRKKTADTYLQEMVIHLYQIIKRSCPKEGEIIHLATMERDLSAPDAGKNRLTAEFSLLLLTELRNKIAKNKDHWKVELDRIFAIKQRTSRAESFGIHRIAQQPLMLYQSRNLHEETTPKEKVIIVDDHIQAGAAIYCAASEVMNRGAHLLGIVAITAHKNSMFFNIQPDVLEFIMSLLPRGAEDLPILNEILKIVGLNLDTLTNVEGMILISILCDPTHKEHQFKFKQLLEKYDGSEAIDHALFKNQKNSLLEEFEKPKVAFANFERELLAAIEKNRYTVSYEKQIVLSDEAGQEIQKEASKRMNLPWLLFDFDDTLHNLSTTTFTIFQVIVKTYSGIEVPIDIIEQTRKNLKDKGHYQYQEMLLAFIKKYKPDIQITCEDITQQYQKHKSEEPFIPKMSKEDFLSLRSKYRIGIITDGSAFESKVPKIKEFYGVDIDGYIYKDNKLPSKPNPTMFHEFCKKYNVKDKPIAYIGDRSDLDGGMAKNANLRFIKVDPTLPAIDMVKFTEELQVIEEQRMTARKRWEFFRNVVTNKTTEMEPVRKFLGLKV
ncbi:HAD hydrolase [Legionella wadsworthii]|uniref:phosphoglycolate phosphatase n=1 Tax=Legionella wadsworthii TaxID=28088 RepID=A0A378LXQ0_9GAMM|nr:HAD family hydrolase [Legionella wadsworthii]STY31342.1 HAD hydrolase [Legionella wadsworthii]